MTTTPTPPRDRIDVERRRAELPFGMETRDEAVNYFAWQADLFRDIARGGVVIDHGAGTGGLTGALVDAGATNVLALEPDPQLVEVLRRKFETTGRARVMAGTLDDYLASEGPGSASCIVSSNVIEHIEDDVACLRAMHEVLAPGGAVGLYVPARPELFGSLDRAVGHFRRYERRELRDKLARAGFTVRSVRYRNVIGVLPWLVTGRVLKRAAIGGGSIRLFDRVVFPVARRVEDWFPPLYGLNLVAIATKA